MPKRIHIAVAAVGIGAALVAPLPSRAASVGFNGLIVNSCLLTLTTGGTLAVDSTGTTLGSEALGGLPATMSVVAVGANPTVSFAAPSLAASPAAYGGNPVVAIRYSSTLGGANQSYTSSNSAYASNSLLDTVTVHARAVDSDGFKSGAYSVATVATCQQ